MLRGNWVRVGRGVSGGKVVISKRERGKEGEERGEYTGRRGGKKGAWSWERSCM